jgi:hypothetical protein
MAEKYFKLDEAEELLPLIASSLEEACKRKQKVESLTKDLTEASARVMMLGGSRPPYATLAKKKAERDQSAAELEEAIAKIQETGCVVKDLDLGLVDFLSLRGGEEVYLCWKLGEERIGYWHGIHEGFAGRKPLSDSAPPGETPPGKGRVH